MFNKLIIIFFFLFLYFYFIESRNIFPKKLFLKNNNKTIERQTLKNSKINKNEEEFFIDYAILVNDEISNEDTIYSHWDICYNEEEYFNKYCQMELMTNPINAEFKDNLYELKIFADGIVDDKGYPIVKIGHKINICLNMRNCPFGIFGNTEDITKIAKVLEAHYDGINNYYIDGLCNDTTKERKQIGLELSDANITINFNAINLAQYSNNNICEISIFDLNIAELKFTVEIFNNYCLLLDYYSQKVAFAPKKDNIKELELLKC